MFAFDLYDTNGDGHLSMQEVNRMIHDIFGEKTGNNVNAKKFKKISFSFIFAKHTLFL
jgi:Ca2+-binding EF-hand superfamily protein